jgi:hypothetical protein
VDGTGVPVEPLTWSRGDVILRRIGIPVRREFRCGRSDVTAVAPTTTAAFPATLPGHPPATSPTPTSPCITEVQYATATADPTPNAGKTEVKRSADVAGRRRIDTAAAMTARPALTGFGGMPRRTPAEPDRFNAAPTPDGATPTTMLGNERDSATHRTFRRCPTYLWQRSTRRTEPMGPRSTPRRQLATTPRAQRDPTENRTEKPTDQPTNQPGRRRSR